MNSKVFWRSILLLAALALSIFLMRHHTTNHPTKAHANKLIVNGFMLHAVYTDYNKDGTLHSHLITPKMLHYTNNNSSFFNKPHLKLYTAKGIPWVITAHYGRSENGSNWVYLWNHVKIHELPDGNSPDTWITTSALTVYPNRSYAQTSREITMKRPNSIISGTGLQANLKTGNYRLLSHSRGLYVPKKSSNS